jgi:Tfp pilus assembly protein PilF
MKHPVDRSVQINGHLMGRRRDHSAGRVLRHTITSLVAVILAGSSQTARAATSTESGAAALQAGEAALRDAVTFGEPTAYARAQQQLDIAERELGSTPAVLRARTNLALTRHEFRSAEELAARALRQSPNDLATRLLAVDASVELGRYDEAQQRLDAAMELRPTAGGFARQSYLLQLRGDLNGAELAMRQALRASEGPTAERAVLLSLLGDLQLEAGRTAQAERSFRQAALIEPRLTLSEIGLARIEARQRNSTAAIARLDRVAERSPSPAVLALRAEISRGAGDIRETRDSEQLLDASVTLFRANGAVIDAELAVQLADRPDPASRAEAVRLARVAYADRHTVFTTDALAWALHRSGGSVERREALALARQAAASGLPAISGIRARTAVVLHENGDRNTASTIANSLRRSAALPLTLTATIGSL